jgi:hypothetical protein
MSFKIHIPDIPFDTVSKTQLFVLVRPFYDRNRWSNELKNEHFNIPDFIHYTANISEAQVILIPLPFHYYKKQNKLAELEKINVLCKQHLIKAYCYVSGDLGEQIDLFDSFYYLRPSGFKGKLPYNNLGFPVPLSDHFQRIYQVESPIIRAKSIKPVIGFCGHATSSLKKRIIEYLKLVKVNARRFFKSPFRNDYEPLFASAYERWKLLQDLESDSEIECRFIYRDKYRAGAQTPAEREQTTIEYYDNMKDADYILCIRGAGNFSVRLYEALMMGKIPIFVDTNCLLPFETNIDWKRHVVWIDWNDRKRITSLVKEFHHSLSREAFEEIQVQNRQLWKNTLSIGGMLTLISYDIQLS